MSAVLWVRAFLMLARAVIIAGLMVFAVPALIIMVFGGVCRDR
jgi:hypothetical protein